MTGVDRKEGHAIPTVRKRFYAHCGSKIRVKGHSLCSLEPQAHSAAPSAQCIPAPQPEEAGPVGLGEVALRERDQRSEVKGRFLSTPSFHSLPLTQSLFLHHLGATAAASQPEVQQGAASKPRPQKGGSEGDFRYPPARGGDECLRGPPASAPGKAGRKCLRGDCRGYRASAPRYVIVPSRRPCPRAVVRDRGRADAPAGKELSSSPFAPFSELLLPSSLRRRSESSAQVPPLPLQLGPRGCHINPWA